MFELILLAFVVGLLFLAAFGIELGVRQSYVELLTQVFEIGRKKIEAHKVADSDEEDNDSPPSPDGSDSDNIISKEGVKLVPNPVNIFDYSFDTTENKFELSDPTVFIKAGVEAIIDDEVTKRFDTQELHSWNLLTRTNKNYALVSMRLTLLWFLGFFFRYFFLLPIRLILMVIGVVTIILSTAMIGWLPDGCIKRYIYWRSSLVCFRVLARSFSGIIRFHDKQYMAKSGGICVANHTSPIDVVILSCDNTYGLVGQSHGGFMGVLQRALARAAAHIWFERSEIKDRSTVANRLKEHVEDLNKLPILIFPEGTCINNTSVMMFKKGCFEVGGIIYPVAIKYDSKFGDAFWNSSKYGYLSYLMMMMTSWAIVCDVWYLPPMEQKPEETAIDFAQRVKAVIAKKGGLVDLVWDGQLKRVQAKPEWMAKQQKEFSHRLKDE